MTETKQPLSVEELLVPRVRLRINIPNSDIIKGQVVVGYKLGNSDKFHFGLGYNPFDYPECFDALAWYEEREEWQMPEYVKVQDNLISAYGEYLQVDKWDMKRLKNIPIAEFGGYALQAGYFLPSTKTDFDEYNRTTNK